MIKTSFCAFMEDVQKTSPAFAIDIGYIKSFKELHNEIIKSKSQSHK